MQTNLQTWFHTYSEYCSNQYTSNYQRFESLLEDPLNQPIPLRTVEIQLLKHVRFLSTLYIYDRSEEEFSRIISEAYNQKLDDRTITAFIQKRPLRLSHRQEPTPHIYPQHGTSEYLYRNNLDAVVNCLLSAAEPLSFAKDPRWDNNQNSTLHPHTHLINNLRDLLGDSVEQLYTWYSYFTPAPLFANRTFADYLARSLSFLIFAKYDNLLLDEIEHLVDLKWLMLAEIISSNKNTLNSLNLLV